MSLEGSEFTDDICWKCRDKLEAIQRIRGAFRVLAQGGYIHRHSQVANIVPVKRRLSKEPQMLVITVRHNPCYRTPNMYKLYHDRSIVTD